MNIIYKVQRLTLLSILSASLASLPLCALGNWKLLEGESDIAFVTVKNSAIAESHTFERFSGTVTNAGVASVQIDLASVQTQIPIRNERMGTMLFNIEKFPQLDINATLDVTKIAKMEEGASIHMSLPAEITLHGAEAGLPLPVVVTRLSSQRYQVVTSKPVIVYASQFEVAAGVEALRMIANLTTITPAVPVTFSLIFEQAL